MLLTFINAVTFKLFFSPAFSDQCRIDDAMFLFSIFDHDVITSNDFGGEAFFALKNVPGVQVQPKKPR
jgi:BAI1-associated protein 3